jgi:CheY-like chemotaxis protein
MCHNWRMQPAVAANAESAMSVAIAAAEQGEPFQLVLTDGSMPDVDGFMLSRQILGDPRLESTVVMMLSSLDRQEDTARCEELGVSAYLLKPVKQSDLFDAIVLALGAHPADAARQPEAETPDTPRLPPLTLLLAEDSLANQKLAVGLLTHWGHEVTVANNGQEAVEAVRTGSFDAVLMDVQMPEVDGLQATQEIRRLERSTDRRLPIIAMTAHAMKGDRERCLEAGMDGYVAKPIRPNVLAAALAEFFPTEPQKSEAGDTAPIASPEPEVDTAAAPGNAIVDWDTALELMQGDRELLGEVVDACLEELPMLVSELRRALEDNNADAVARYAHTIKGNLRTFSINGLEQAQSLESAGLSADLSQAAELYQSLQVDLDRFVVELQQRRSHDRQHPA